MQGRLEPRSKDEQLGRWAGFATWTVALVLVIELLAYAVNLLVLEFGGGAPNPEFDPQIGARSTAGGVLARWGGQLTAVAPPWIVGLQAVALAVTLVIVARTKREYLGRVGPILLIAVPGMVFALAVFLAAYIGMVIGMGADVSVCDYAIPLVLTFVVGIVALIRTSFIIVGARMTARRARHGRRGPAMRRKQPRS